MNKFKEYVGIFACPGVPYPLSAVAHLVVGACIACIIPQVTGNGDPSVWATWGSGIGAVAGFIAWLYTKP